MTICTYERQVLFESATRVTSVLDDLLRTADAYSVAIVAYCFMPDHLHMLVEGCSDDTDVRRFVVMFKQRSAHGYKRLESGRLWQSTYYDRVLRENETSFEVARYIATNPLRAGLCETIADYPFVGSSRYLVEELAGSVQWRIGRP